MREKTLIWKGLNRVPFQVQLLGWQNKKFEVLINVGDL